MKLRTREIIFLAVLAAVPVGAWFFVFEPRNQEIAQSRRTIAAMETTLSRLDQLTSSVGDVRVAIDEAEARLSDFRHNIPDAEEVDDLLAEMNEIGVRNNLKFASIRALKQNEIQEHLEIPLTMNLEADFVGVYRFLSDLERLPRIVRVQTLEIERNLVAKSRDGGRPQDSLDVSMTVVVYCEGEGADV